MVAFRPDHFLPMTDSEKARVDRINEVSAIARTS
jgi:hypothetical protein